MTEALKKTRPLGQVKLLAWPSLQTVTNSVQTSQRKSLGSKVHRGYSKRVLNYEVGELTVRDVPKCPLHDSKLHNARPQGGDDLAEEHNSLRDLEVMAELQIIQERVGLIHRNVAVGFEKHHCYWTPRLHISDDVFGEDI